MRTSVLSISFPLDFISQNILEDFFKELDDEEGRVYLLCVDVPGIKSGELGEQVSRVWDRSMNKSELVILNGKYGDRDDAD